MTAQRRGGPYASPPSSRHQRTGHSGTANRSRFKASSRVSSAADRPLRTKLMSKSLRKVQAQISEHGPDGVVVVLQGKMEGGSCWKPVSRHR